MIMALRIMIAATLILLSISSCSVQKRHYRNGFHVAWLQKKSHHQTPAQNAESEKNKLASQSIAADKETLVAANERDDLSLSLNKTNTYLLPPDTCNDQMLMKNGDMITAKVTEITEEQIKYKRCDNLNGPSYSIGKEKVHSITYSNGVKEIIEPPSAIKKVTKAEDAPAGKKIYPSQLKWAAFLTFTPYINYIGIPIGLFLALRARRKILSQPTLYKGINLADYILFFDVMIGVLIIGLVILSRAMFANGLFLLGLALVLAALIGIVAGAIYYGLK